MKKLIVYDSLYGNTEKVAKAIGKGVGAEDFEMKRARDTKWDDLGKIDLLIVGSPTHGGRASENTQKFFDSIKEEDLKNVYAAAFDTSVPSEGKSFFAKFFIKTLGYAAERILKILKKKGADTLKAESFFVLGKEGPLREGELERAEKWGKEVLDSIGK